MSLSEKIVSGLTLALLIFGFASRVVPKQHDVSPLGASSASPVSCPTVGQESAVGKGISFGRHSGHG